MSERANQPGAWRLSLAVGLAVAALMLLLIVLSEQGPAWNVGRAQFDQDRFHLRVIETFARQLPAPDLRDYLSATTPLYHLALSVVKAATGVEAVGLRALASLFAALLAATVCFAALRRGLPALHAVALTLPIVACSYVVQSGVYLLPDNAAWWMVTMTMLAALSIARDREYGESGEGGEAVRADSSLRTPNALGQQPARRAAPPISMMIGVALLLCALVATRQIHLWAAAAVWAGVIVSACAGPSPTVSALLASLRNRRVWIGVLFTLPAFAVVAGFVALWGGLAPPMFRNVTSADATAVTGLSPATPAFVLALIGICGVFTLGYHASALRRFWRERVTIRCMTIGSVAAGAIAMIAPTTWSSPSRKGGLWNITQKFEGVAGADSVAGVRLPRLVIADHTNLVMLALAMVGGAVLGLLWRSVDGRARWVLAASLLGFIAASSAQALSWQRYVEPFVLVWLALCAACVPRGADERPPAWAIAGPLALAAMLAVVCWAQFGS